MPLEEGPDRSQDPWLDPESLRAAQAAGRTPHEYLAGQFEAERELLQVRVRELRANLQARRLDLRRLERSRASEDAPSPQ